MEKTVPIDSDVNYSWNFLNYPIYTVSAEPQENTSLKDCAILLIHGFGASTDHWRFNIPVLSNKYEVHAIDLLGFGKSPKPEDVEYSGSLWKDQVIAYVKEKINKPTIIIGNSLGSLVGLTCAVNFSNEVAALIASPLPDQVYSREIKPFCESTIFHKFKFKIVKIIILLIPLEIILFFVTKIGLIELVYF